MRAQLPASDISCSEGQSSFPLPAIQGSNSSVVTLDPLKPLCYWKGWQGRMSEMGKLSYGWFDDALVYLVLL